MDAKAIRKEAKKANDSRIRELYFEVYGASFSGFVTVERARESVIEACTELIEEKHKPTKEDREMENVLKLMIEMLKENAKRTDVLILEMEKTIKALENGEPKKRGKKGAAAEAPAETPPTVIPAGDTATGLAPEKTAPTVVQTPEVEKPKAITVADVTIEMIREKATEYSDPKNFGMDAWLTLAQQVTGQKKVKDIPKEMYGAFYGAMDVALSKRKAETAALQKPSLPPAGALPGMSEEDQKKAAAEGAARVRALYDVANTAPKTPPAPAGEVTIEQLKTAGKTFMDKNGQPALIALVKAFGATKISEVAPEKRGALLEAFTNA